MNKDAKISDFDFTDVKITNHTFEKQICFC